MKPHLLIPFGLVVALSGVAFGEPVHQTQSPSGGFRRVVMPRPASAPIDSSVPKYSEMLAAPLVPGGIAPTHILYLNPCTNGCNVKISNGTTDNRTDTWGAGSGAQNGTLTKYPRSAAHWQTVMNCVKTEFAPFNVQVTDVDPGQTSHFEVMVGGSACSILSGSSCDQIGGVALSSCDPNQPGNCDAFEPNALAFDFANSWSTYPNPDNEDCSTIGQEIAHTWSLDHVVDSHDPMTYNEYNGQHLYHNAETCGSDCLYQDNQGHLSNGFVSCTGTNSATATHVCYGSGTTKQDELTTILALFGSSAPDNTPPTIMITSPADGASVMPKFQIQTTANDDQGISMVSMEIDGHMIQTLGAFPYTFTAPATLAMGNHTVTVTAQDIMGNMASDTIMVHYGDPCTKPADCPNATDTCVGGTCVAGMDAPGGLGTACTTNDQCDSGQCVSDGTQSVCVTGCDTTTNACPSGFGCVGTSMTATTGVCFPGADSGGGGGCSSGSNGGGVAFFGIALGLAALSRRRVARA